MRPIPTSLPFWDFFAERTFFFHFKDFQLLLKQKTFYFHFKDDDGESDCDGDEDLDDEDDIPKEEIENENLIENSNVENDISNVDTSNVDNQDNIVIREPSAINSFEK